MTEDGTIHPLLAFAYDLVFLAITAVRAAREKMMAQSGANLLAIDLDL